MAKDGTKRIGVLGVVRCYVFLFVVRGLDGLSLRMEEGNKKLAHTLSLSGGDGLAFYLALWTIFAIDDEMMRYESLL